MSLSLPRALLPWSAPLHALVPELALALGPMVLGLARALGPFASVSSAGREEPDGLSGLSRRGPYDRLLSSELALLDIDPDEFLRRASSSEHLFFDLQRQSPRDGRRCIVLFDAGPDQIGPARLAHIALLLVFERRALEARAELCWQILQRPGHVLHAADREGIRALLAGRSIDLPSDASLQACLEATPPRSGDEVWVAGGLRATALAGPRAGRLSIDVRLSGESPQGDALLIEVSSQGRQRLSLSLPLPPQEIRTALIRDPLRIEHPDAIVPPSRGRSVSPLMPFLAFSPEGSRLICREQSGNLLAFPVPSLHRRPARLELSARDKVIAAGWSHHKLGAVLQRGGQTVLLYPPHSRTLSDADLAPDLPEQPALLCIVNDHQRTLVAHFAAGGRCWQWPLDRTPLQSRGPTLGITRRDGVIVDGHTTIHQHLLPNTEPCDRIWFGPGQLCAVHLPSDDSWALIDPSVSISKAVRLWRIAGEVIGTTYGRPDRSLAVLVSAGRPGPLLLRYVDGSEVVLSPRALAAAASSGPRPFVAFIEAGERQLLVLYDPLVHRTVSSREIAP